MHLLEGPDLGYSTIYYDRKLEGKIEEKEKKALSPAGFEPST